MRPFTLVLNGMVAAPDMVPLVVTSNGPGQLVVVKVVNCAVAFALLPPEQFALTLQSYNVPDARLPILTDVEEIPEARLSQVADELALYSVV